MILLYKNLQKLSLSLVLIGVAFTFGRARGADSSAATAAAARHLDGQERASADASNRYPRARVNGIKALVLMQRSGEMVATVDDKLVTSDDAVTSMPPGSSSGTGRASSHVRPRQKRG